MIGGEVPFLLYSSTSFFFLGWSQGPITVRGRGPKTWWQLIQELGEDEDYHQIFWGLIKETP